ncbi:hypothetical protein [Dyadobacter koreensis]|uniref:hypothetical protein n=1 Tax=Dyadobacter koreensis TaxID=408657 RepID=UPI0015A690A6|nr:hypothetical protein [Dyadobacter koreensis]
MEILYGCYAIMLFFRHKVGIAVATDEDNKRKEEFGNFGRSKSWDITTIPKFEKLIK